MLAVFLDFSEAINRLGKDVVAQRRDIASRQAKNMCDEGRGVGPKIDGVARGVYLDFSEAISRMGRAAVSAKYGNLFDMYEEITDVSPYENPMMIYPAIHYTMGGIWVDYELMTSIKGLFAIGECNFSDHGANRLGASALMQGLADGYFVLPYTIQNYLIMWEYVGMGRTAEGLKEGLKKLKEVRKEFEKELFIPGDKEGMNVELDKAIRLYDFITMGELVAYDALNRNESCGGHFREEYQTEEGEAKRDDENYFYVACWEYQGSDEKEPVLLKEPLVYEAIKVQTRNYKS